MKKISIYFMLTAFIIFTSCNKEKRYSTKLMKGEIWAIESVQIGSETSELLGDWQVIQDVSIHDTVPTVKWVLADYTALFEWQFQNKGKDFQLNYHILCDEIDADELDTLDYFVYDLTGTYNVERHGRSKMIFSSENTIGFGENKVEIEIQRKE